MANQYVNKVVVNNEIKMDLTEDTITPNTLRKGFTAHDASGAPIVGNESLTDISDGTTAGPILELTAEGWAEQDTLSGKNLLPNTASGTQTVNGVTFTVNPDKSITCTGTATVDTYFELAPVNTVLGYLASDTTYLMSGVTNGSASTYQLLMRTASTDKQDVTTGGNETKTSASTSFRSTGNKVINRVAIIVYSGATVDTTIYPQLELGNTATDYEPYCGAAPSPSPDYPQEIKVARGRNLLSVNSGSISSASFLVPSRTPCVLDAGTYTFSLNIKSYSGSGALTIYFRDATHTLVATAAITPSVGRKSVTVTVPSDCAEFDAYYGSAMTAEQIQLEEGSVATPYVPYGHVGMEVQGKNLLGYTLADLKALNTNGSWVDNAYTRFGCTFVVNDDGSIVTTGTPTSTAVLTLMSRVLAAGTYTLSGGRSAPNRLDAYHDTASTGNEMGYDTGNGLTFTADGTQTIIIRVRLSTTATNPTTYYPMLEHNDRVTSYVPYYHSTIPIPLPERGWVGALPDGTADILKLDGAGGYEWTIKSKSANFENLTWERDTAFTPFFYTTSLNADIHKTGNTIDLDVLRPVYSNRFKDSNCSPRLGDSYWSALADGSITIHQSAEINPAYIYVKYSSITTVDDFVSWIMSNPTNVIYPLAIPFTESGYIDNWTNDFPLECSIDIPELRNMQVEYFIEDAIPQLDQDYYARIHNNLPEFGRSVNSDDNVLTFDAIKTGTTDAGQIAELTAKGHATQFTVSGKNLLPNEARTWTTNGVTFTVNADGSINMNGTATAGTSFNLATNLSLASGTYTLSTKTTIPSGLGVTLAVQASSGNKTVNAGSNSTTFTDSINGLGWIRISNGVTVSNLTIYPQLELGSSATEYEPYVGGTFSPNPSFPQDIQVVTGRNLWPFGSTWTTTAGAQSNPYRQKCRLSVGTYIFSFECISFTSGSNNNYQILAFDSNCNLITKPSAPIIVGKNVLKIVLSCDCTYIEFYTGAPWSIKNIQLEKSLVSHEYVPYGNYVNVDILGRNLLNPADIDAYTRNNVTFTKNSDGTVTFSGTTNAQWFGYVRNKTSPKELFRPKNGIYTFLVKGTIPSSVTVRVTTRNASNGTIQQLITSGGTDKSITFEVTDNVANVILTLSAPSGVTINTTIAFQLNEGSTAIPYEPYYYDTVPIPLPPRGWAGSLPDGTADSVSIDGAGHVTWELKTEKYVFEGSSNDVYAENTVGGLVVGTNKYIVDAFPNNAISSLISTHGMPNTADYQWNHTSDAGIVALNNIGRVLFLFPTSLNHASVTDAKKWLSANPVTVLYPLSKSKTVDCGYIDWPQIPDHATITCPELDGLDIQYYTDYGITQLTREYHDRYVDKTNLVTIDANDAGPILSLVGEGHAEQFTTTGKNLAAPNMNSGSYPNETRNGITWVRNPDGSLHVSGLATADSKFNLGSQAFVASALPAGTYTISMWRADGAGGGLHTRYGNDSNNAYIGELKHPISQTITLSETRSIRFDITVLYGTNIDTDISIQIEAGTVATPYEPYTGGQASPNPSYPQDIQVLRGRNLLPNNASTTTTNGVTFTVNPDGSINVNGTASARTIYIINIFNLDAGTYTISDGNASNGALYYFECQNTTDGIYYDGLKVTPSGFTFTIDATKSISSYIVVDKNKTVNNVTFYPQLERGSIAHDYVPYGYIGMDVQGRNLAANDNGIVTTDGITFTPLADGGIWVRGTATANAFYWMRMASRGIALSPDTYTMTVSGLKNAIIAQFVYTTTSSSGLTYLIGTSSNSSLTATMPDDIYGSGWRIYVPSGNTVNTIVYMQIEAGSTAHDYEPYYHKTIPVPLPERGYIASLPDGTVDTLKLDGAGGYEWECKTNMETFDGDETWGWGNARSVPYIAWASNTSIPLIKFTDGNNSTGLQPMCDKFIFKGGYTAYGSDKGGFTTSSNDNKGTLAFAPTDDSITTVAAWTTWLASNPVTVLYPLATPVTESGYIDDWTNDIPPHAIISCPELENVGVRCFVNSSVAELEQAWSKRYESRIAALEEAVAELIANG